MSKCEINKIALELYWNWTSEFVLSSTVAVYFQKTFSEEILWTAAALKLKINEWMSQETCETKR